ncbi:hypothetical protein MC885_005546, partial [Smutsia gigantea]
WGADPELVSKDDRHQAFHTRQPFEKSGFPALQQGKSSETKPVTQKQKQLLQKMKEELKEVKKFYLSLQVSCQSLKERYLLDLQVSLESLQEEKCSHIAKFESLQQLTQLEMMENLKSCPQDFMFQFVSLLLTLATSLLVFVATVCAYPLLVMNSRLCMCTMVMLIGLGTLAWQKVSKVLCCSPLYPLTPFSRCSDRTLRGPGTPKLLWQPL